MNMICKSCHAENPEGALRCAKCSALLPGADALQTIMGPAPASPPPDTPRSDPGDATLAGPPPNGSRAPSGGGDPGTELAPGTELGPRYRILSLLGKGGMGAVYKAHDAELNRTVALKLIRPDLVSRPESMQRFKQELLLASRISHKNILRIHDLVEVGGIRFISMAYVDGEDLHALLQREGRLPLDQIIRIARQLCAALDAAHAEGIIHRDLKPGNVLIDREGNVYVLDFGLAKSLEAGATQMTHTGEMLGTPQYMSPEQVQGTPVDHRSDLYALGLMLYELAVGQVPFASESVYQTMFLRTRERPKDPRLLNAELPDFLDRIILRCLETDPARRYQSAHEILRDLDAAQPPPRRLSFSLLRLGSRTWILPAGVLLALLAILLATPRIRQAIFTRTPASPDRSAGAHSPAERKSVAVLPFTVVGDESSLGYIATGVGEALSARLFQLKDVFVPSFTEAQSAAGAGSLDMVARNLGVKFIVHGTVTAAGDKIAFVVNLQDVARGERVWTKEFPGLAGDLLTLEDQIYGELLAALNLTLDTEERARSATRSTENIEAYDLYLKGRNALRGHQDVANVKAAIALYEQALQKDAGFALAYVGLADGSLAMYRETKDAQWAQKAVAAGEQARRLNDQLPEVNLSLGSIYSATGKPSEAIAVLTQTLALAPNSDEAYRRLGAAYEAAGRSEEAIAAYRKATEINPYYWLNFSALGGAYFKTGKFEEALAPYRRITELEPGNVWGFLNVGAVFFSQGKYEECIAPFRKALEIQPSWPTLSNLGTAFFYLKRYPESVESFEKAVAMNPNQELVVGNLADAYRASGLAAKASATYEKAIALAYKELEVNPRDPGPMANLALYYAKTGNPSRALNFVRRARSIDAEDVDYIYTEAVVRALAGQPQESITTLRLALEKGYALADAMNNPELAPVRDLPEFRGLVAEFGRADSLRK
jgi:eukaryotic-like serine/threonine-protein kinase